MNKIDRRCEKILFSHQQIVAACKKAAKWIDKKFKNKKLTISNTSLLILDCVLLNTTHTLVE